LTLMQMQLDWKGRADAHKRTLDIYAEVKREAGWLIASGEELDEQACRRVFARYDIASAVGVAIPEGDFLYEKRRHKTKVALSKHLDQYPFAFIWLIRMKFWMRDNFGR